MPKLSCFVITYSIVLIVLFITFSYLITTVNPPKLKPDTDRARKFGMIEDEFSYPELLPTDKEKFGYGLEKVDYDMIIIKPDIYTSTCTEILETNETDSENYKTNCSRKQIDVEIVTEPMNISVKGFRRSISENKKLDNPRSLLLKIINYGGDPQVELKIVAEKNKNYFNKYGSADSNVQRKTNLTNTSDADYNDANRGLIDLNENETLIIKINPFKINDSIEYEEAFRDNKTSYNEREINLQNILPDEVKPNVTFREEESNDVLKDNNNQDIKITSNFEITTQNTDLNMSFLMPTAGFNNSTEIVELSNKTTNSTNNNIANSNILKVEADVKGTIDKSNPTADLLGILIPEATATLPYNYHFIT